jgi:hypothetical protein
MGRSRPPTGRDRPPMTLRSTISIDRKPAFFDVVGNLAGRLTDNLAQILCTARPFMQRSEHFNAIRAPTPWRRSRRCGRSRRRRSGRRSGYRCGRYRWRRWRSRSQIGGNGDPIEGSGRSRRRSGDRGRGRRSRWPDPARCRELGVKMRRRGPNQRTRTPRPRPPAAPRLPLRTSQVEMGALPSGAP